MICSRINKGELKAPEKYDMLGQVVLRRRRLMKETVKYWLAYLIMLNAIRFLKISKMTNGGLDGLKAEHL
jgi:hypothetical protein